MAGSIADAPLRQFEQKFRDGRWHLRINNLDTGEAADLGSFTTQTELYAFIHKWLRDRYGNINATINALDEKASV